jgi:hypothetical protein
MTIPFLPFLPFLGVVGFFGGTVIDSDEASQTGETRRSVDSIVDVQDASLSTPFNGEA